MAQDVNAVRVRTLFLSDLHLGTKGCQAAALLEFLQAYDADTIYLVGDIVDGWRLKSGWYWPQSHNDVIQKLLRKVRKGARLVYIPGNHDEFLRDYIGHNFGGGGIVDHAIHETARAGAPRAGPAVGGRAPGAAPPPRPPWASGSS